MKTYLKIIFVLQLLLVIVLGFYSIRFWQENKVSEQAAVEVSPLKSAKNLVKNYLGFLNGSSSEPISQEVGIKEGAVKNDFSDLLFSTEVYELPGKSVSIPPELLQEYESVKRRFSPDNHLSIIKYGGEDFKTSSLREKLNQVLTTKLYVIVRFDQGIGFPVLNKLKRLGFSPLNQFPLSEYIDKKIGIFYVRYNKIYPAVNAVSQIDDIYILTEYTARGFYQLGMKSLAINDNLELEIKFPFSKEGRELLYKKNTISGTSDLIQKNSTDQKSSVSVPFDKGQIVTFHSDLRYRISLEALLDTHIRVQGKDYNLKRYHQEMQGQYSEIHEEFTQFSEKIVSSDYIDSIIDRIDTNASIAQIWKQMTKILDREIHYDWQKRELFFSGNLTYHNIKNMYMTAEELGKKRVGACTERTALEIALLRKLGVASRAATRLYHIYTEIYIPDTGWTTTSLTLNEIPLDASEDENMSYFVSWEPNHPIRLKWEGYMYPNIIY